jgi:hypothetical protein
MSCSKQSSENSERLARLEEDRAVALEKLPPFGAFATALTVEALLADEWSVEQSKMMERNDTRKVLQISTDNLEMTRAARKLVPPDVEVDIIPMNRVLALLTGFPPDQLWMAAFTVAWRVGMRALRKQRQRFHDCLLDSARVPKISDLDDDTYADKHTRAGK